MARLTPFDRVFLLVLAPLWLVVFALHTVNAATGRLAEPSVYVGSPECREDFPVVRSLRVGGAAGSSGLQLGDELLQIGDNDLRGAGPLRFFAVAWCTRRSLNRESGAHGRSVTKPVPSVAIRWRAASLLPLSFRVTTSSELERCNRTI